jgi:tetratricopeptide (TPR) repeat protein
MGRDEEVRRLADALSRVEQARHAEVILMRGEPGIGKSRMLEHASRYARESGAEVIEASAHESETIRPFALWIDALRGLEDRGAEQVFGLREVENRDRLFEGLSRFVADRAGARPLVLVLDDIQWCDESSAAALHYVLRMNRQRPLLGVLAARDGELQDNSPLQQALRGLRRLGMLHEWELRPLPATAIAALIAARSPAADSERLSRECGGNPLLAIELARAEQQGAEPGPLEQLVRERLAQFGVDGAEVLHWAAVLRPRIEVSMLQALTEQSADDIAAMLEHAERQGILSSTGSGLRFSHELIARAVYTGISPVRRRIMHRRIAERMAEDTALDLDHASDLARHAMQSGDPALAARAMVSAGRLSLRFFANDEAVSLARKGLQLAEQLPAAERVCLGIDLHGILFAAAPLDDWEDGARRYVALAEQALDHGALAHARRAYDMAAYVRWEHGQWDGAREQSLQSERVARGGSDKDQIVGMAITAKCLAMLERDLPHADAMLMEAQGLAARKRIRHHAIPAGLGMLRFYENRLDEAEELLKEARTLCKSAGDRIDEYQANEYLVMIDIQRGSFTEAKARCEELLEIGGKLRAGSEGPFACALYGLCMYALDDDSAPLEKALAELRIADAKHRLAYVLTRAALLDYERERIDAALTHAGEALTYAELLERRTETMMAHAVLGLGHQAAGHRAKAKAHFAKVTGLEAEGVAEWARGMTSRLAPPDRRRHA